MIYSITDKQEQQSLLSVKKAVELLAHTHFFSWIFSACYSHDLKINPKAACLAFAGYYICTTSQWK